MDAHDSNLASPAFGSASASSQGTKEAANPKEMTFTRFSNHHFPKRCFAWRNGYFHCLS
jgi:hypothetical protein